MIHECLDGAFAISHVACTHVTPDTINAAGILWSHDVCFFCR